MNNRPASFHISKHSNLIHADINGVWNITTDMDYLNELASTMQSMRGNPWAMVIDMRGWFVPEEMKRFKRKTAIHLDRRNQKLECWIVDNAEQGNHLKAFVEAANIPFKQFTDTAEAEKWLTTFHYSMP